MSNFFVADDVETGRESIEGLGATHVVTKYYTGRGHHVNKVISTVSNGNFVNTGIYRLVVELEVVKAIPVAVDGN